jgi:hypothetical protein
VAAASKFAASVEGSWEDLGLGIIATSTIMPIGSMGSHWIAALMHF